MAVTRGTLTESETTNTGNSVSTSVVLDNGSGVTDRALVVFVTGSGGPSRTITACTLDGTAFTAEILQGSVDGGTAITYGVFVFDSSDLPTSSGTYTLTATFSGTRTNACIASIEYTDVDQTTPIENTTTATHEADQGAPNTIANTLTGASGEYGISWAGMADGSATMATVTHTKPTDFTQVSNDANLFSSAGSNPCAMAIAEDISVNSSSEALSWSVDNDVSATMDSNACFGFSIKAAAGGAAANPKGPLGHPFYGPFRGPIS